MVCHTARTYIYIYIYKIKHNPVCWLWVLLLQIVTCVTISAVIAVLWSCVFTKTGKFFLEKIGPAQHLCYVLSVFGTRQALRDPCLWRDFSCEVWLYPLLSREQQRPCFGYKGSRRFWGRPFLISFLTSLLLWQLGHQDAGAEGWLWGCPPGCPSAGQVLPQGRGTEHCPNGSGEGRTASDTVLEMYLGACCFFWQRSNLERYPISEPYEGACGEMIISLPFLFLPFFFFNVSQFYYLGLCSDVFHIILAALANCVFPLT